MWHKGMKLLAIGGLLISQSAFAVYCSTPFGNGYVNPGDTMGMVQAVFGAPSSQLTQKVLTPGFQTTQFWMYSNTTATSNNPLGEYPPKPVVSQSGPVIVFQIVDGRVTAITENGKNVASTMGCKGGTLRVGVDANTVTAGCGQPNNISMDNSNNANQEQEVTVWTYGNNTMVVQFDALGKLQTITGCSN